MAALRQIAARGKEIENAKAYLFMPGETYAVHQGSQNGTPLPHEEPQELNPPAGVLAYYWLKSAPGGPVKLELVDASGAVAACVASDTPVKPVDTEAINVQAYWEQPTAPPSAEPGMHRIALNVAAPRASAWARGALQLRRPMLATQREAQRPLPLRRVLAADPLACGLAITP